MRLINRNSSLIPQTGYHKNDRVFSEIKLYLQREWDRLADIEGSRPRQWESEHKRPDFLSLTKSIYLNNGPTQKNGYDCGLFMLCSIQFFCHANPKSLPYSVLKDLNDKCMYEMILFAMNEFSLKFLKFCSRSGGRPQGRPQGPFRAG